MRKLVIAATLLLMPVTALANSTKTEDGICYAQEEFKMAQDNFYRESRGHYDGESVAMLASEVDRKRLVYMQLQEQYEKQYGKPFNGNCYGDDHAGQVVK